MAEQKKRARAPQKEISPSEKSARIAEGRTQGRAGCAMDKLTFRVTPDRHEFVIVMARLSGMSLTKFMNHIIDDYADHHADLYERARQIAREAGTLTEEPENDI